MSPEATLLLAPALPLAGSAAIAALGSRPNLREAATLTTAAALLVLVLSLLPTLDGGVWPRVTVAEPIPGLAIALHAEPLGLLFALVASFLWLVTSVYAIGYMRGHGESNQTRFYVFFAIAIASAIGVAFAANMFTLFVFYEVLTLSTYPLVTHSGSEEARRAGRLYLGILLGTSLVLQLLAIVWTWQLTGTLDFTSGGVMHDTVPAGVASVLLVLYVFGIGKAAVMPLHRWLPAAMVAPTPVSALLHAVAVVKAGVFTIVKVAVYLFGIDFLATLGSRDWLLYVVAATILIGSLVAMRQDNLKARLAYSTVSQLSYIVLGALLANAWGIVGGGMHIVMHAFGKITLFFCAGAIMVAAHKTEISQMRGLGRAMPITMGAFFIGSISVIGLPPAGGLWSKWYLALGTLDAQQAVLLGVLLLSSLLNLAYLLPIPVRAFLSPDHGKPMAFREAPLASLLALSVSSAGCIALFFFPGPVLQLMQRAITP
ncbi:MAG: monovalent cation/H+ antiporter subunit D family protein [Gammaproteobacteria bacterium]|nr:monovalent cation/H+ antiporter subunit D family protein [Gammaproteobacteria bacterium]